MMAMDRKQYSIAISSAERIRRYWREHVNSHLFHKPEVSIHPGTYAIVSDIVNGFPPRR